EGHRLSPSSRRARANHPGPPGVQLEPRAGRQDQRDPAPHVLPPAPRVRDPVTSASRAAVALSLALVSCRSHASAEATAASGSAAPIAPPPPLDTSWEQNPGRTLAPKDRAPDFEGIAH